MDLLIYLLAGAGVFVAYGAYAVATLAGWGARMRVAMCPLAADYYPTGAVIIEGGVEYRVARNGPGEVWVHRPLWWRCWRWVTRWRR